LCTDLHYSIYKKLGIQTAENWYSHIRKAVCEREDKIILWNPRGTKGEILACRPNIIIKNKTVGHVTRMGEGKGVYRILVGRPEGKRPLGKPRHR